MSVSRGCEAGVRTQATVTQNLHVTRTLCCHPKEPRLELKSHRSSKMQWILRCEQGRLSPPMCGSPVSPRLLEQRSGTPWGPRPRMLPGPSLRGERGPHPVLILLPAPAGCSSDLSSGRRP